MFLMPSLPLCLFPTPANLWFLLPTTVTIMTVTVTKNYPVFHQELKLPHIRFFSYLFVCI